MTISAINNNSSINFTSNQSQKTNKAPEQIKNGHKKLAIALSCTAVAAVAAIAIGAKIKSGKINLSPETVNQTMEIGEEIKNKAQSLVARGTTLTNEASEMLEKFDRTKLEESIQKALAQDADPKGIQVTIDNLIYNIKKLDDGTGRAIVSLLDENNKVIASALSGRTSYEPWQTLKMNGNKYHFNGKFIKSIFENYQSKSGTKCADIVYNLPGSDNTKIRDIFVDFKGTTRKHGIIQSKSIGEGFQFNEKQELEFHNFTPFK